MGHDDPMDTDKEPPAQEKKPADTKTVAGAEVRLIPPGEGGKPQGKEAVWGVIESVTPETVTVKFKDASIGTKKIPREYWDGAAKEFKKDDNIGDEKEKEEEEDDDAEPPTEPPIGVWVHSLPLLSTVDHHQRLTAGASNKRVVGIVLGSNQAGRINITNSFAVPFEEDPKSPDIWYFDHHYMEDMYSMFKKVNAKEKIVGWYSTGPKLKPNDLQINQVLRRYCQYPVYVIIRVTEEGEEEGIPCTAYKAIEKIEDERSGPKLAFVHLPTQLKCSSMEEVGVAHLLRDIQDYTAHTLSSHVKDKEQGLRSLQIKLTQIREYLQMVVDEKLPVNNEIMYNIQDIFNTLPALNMFKSSPGMATEVNDGLMVSYMGQVMRAVVALHNLILNKFEMKRLKEEAEKKKKEADEKKKKELEEKKKKAEEEKEKKKKEKKEKA